MTQHLAESPSSLLLVPPDDRRARQVALLAAILLHGLLLTASFPSFARRAAPQPPQSPPPIRLASLRVPPPSHRPQVTPVALQDLRTFALPVPDPDPDAPEPLSGEPARAASVPDTTVTGVDVALLPLEAPGSAPHHPGVDVGVTFPRLIEGSRVSPRYPQAARQARLQDRVILRAVVHMDGTVDRIEVLRVSHPGVGFEKEAVDAVRQWRYEPGRFHGRPVDVYFTIVVDFVLQ